MNISHFCQADLLNSRPVKNFRVSAYKKEIIVITLLAVMAFAEGWEDIEKYGNAKEGWLKRRIYNEKGEKQIGSLPSGDGGLSPAKPGSFFICGYRAYCCGGLLQHLQVAWWTENVPHRHTELYRHVP
jgi:hypothetical protein